MILVAMNYQVSYQVYNLICEKVTVQIFVKTISFIVYINASTPISMLYDK